MTKYLYVRGDLWSSLLISPRHPGVFIYSLHKQSYSTFNNLKSTRTLAIVKASTLKLLPDYEYLINENSYNYNEINSLVVHSLKSKRPEDLLWLVGVIDGKGIFDFYISQNTWHFSLTILVDPLNLLLLHKIKTIIGFGQIFITRPINKSPLYNQAKFIINDPLILKQRILPIFDRYPLLTKKEFDLELFKKALFVYLDDNITSIDKYKNLISLYKFKLNDST